MARIILHVDLDCFYASVEKRDNPAYAGKPLVVGADPSGGAGRGVVLTASYEARKFGIKSGMPISRAYRACPTAIYMRPSFPKYLDASRQVMAILKPVSTGFQSGGLDEAYIDVTEKCPTFDAAYALAEAIRKEVRERVGITCSIGIGPTRSLAKIATDIHKPDGITTITPETIEQVTGHLDIDAIPGIGKKTRQHYIDKGVKTLGDLYRMSLPGLVFLLGPRAARWLHDTIHGIETGTLREHRGRKSISKERTFSKDVADYATITTKLQELNKRLHDNARSRRIRYQTVTLKIRFEGFETFSRSMSAARAIQDEGRAFAMVTSMLEPFKHDKRRVRLVGIKLSNLEGTTRGCQQRAIDDFVPS
ncbi:MAG: DNA polymerase IV [Candidatus Lokiarchaeota archaeon]|nr:DNA polymerase IV [Candidatus Lokiarchaeota archaeon]